MVQMPLLFLIDSMGLAMVEPKLGIFYASVHMSKIKPLPTTFSGRKWVSMRGKERNQFFAENLQCSMRFQKDAAKYFIAVLCSSPRRCLSRQNFTKCEVWHLSVRATDLSKSKIAKTQSSRVVCKYSKVFCR